MRSFPFVYFLAPTSNKQKSLGSQHLCYDSLPFQSIPHKHKKEKFSCLLRAFNPKRVEGNSNFQIFKISKIRDKTCFAKTNLNSKEFQETIYGGKTQHRDCHRHRQDSPRRRPPQPRPHGRNRAGRHRKMCSTSREHKFHLQRAACLF